MAKPETRMRNGAVKIVLVVLVSIACLTRMSHAQETVKSPVPKSAAQSKAEHFVQEHYKADFALNDPADQLSLSTKLRNEIDQYRDDPPTRFVMLRDARELAVDAGDLDAAFAAIDDMDHLFLIDAREMKFSAMSALIDKSTLPPPQLIDKYLHLADTALSTGDVDFAQKAYVLASMLSDQQRDPGLKQQVKTEHIAIMDGVREQKKILTAMNRARAHPEDGQANLLVGNYACFVRQLWPQGLPYLARSSDEKLKALAQQELDASDPDSKTTVADGWWAYAAAVTGKTAERARVHAADLYREALPALSDTKKATAEQRAQQGTPPSEQH